MNLRNEIWKDIPDYNNYQVSNFGQVRSNISGEWKILKPRPYGGFNGPTYYRVNLKGKNFGIHRLVAIAFIPNPDNKPEVDHIDQNPSNNYVGNLRWSTRLENRHNRKDYKDGRK